MRWIFIFLVFLNIFFYIWQRQQVSPSLITNPSITSYTEQNIPTIKLLKEQPIATIPAADNIKEQETPTIDPITEAAPKENLIDSVETAPEPLTCLYLGGFTNQEQLTVINPFLNEIARNINPIAVKLTHSPQFYLYITTNSAEQQQEFLKKLNTNLIGSLIINRGPLKDNISIGLFPNKTSYLSVEDQLRNLDLPLKIENLPEAASSYWLKIPNQQRDLFSHTVLTELMQRLPTVQQELMPCELIED